MPTFAHDFAAFSTLASRHKVDPHRIKRFRIALYKHGRSDEEALSELPESLAAQVRAEGLLHPLKLVHRIDSTRDAASRLVFETPEGHHIEAVILRIQSGRTSLCISSQVGCAQACDFCATGRMGIAKNLSAAQIIDQVVQAMQIVASEGRKIRNVVFMGMGEPLANEPNVTDALELLLAKGGFDLSPRHLLVSTVGLPEPMLRLARRFPDLGLALSLHTARPDRRLALMPITRRQDLDELHRTLHELHTLRSGEMMIEYLMLKDVNDSLEDAAALRDFVQGLNVMINLIPYNQIAEAPHLQRSDQDQYDRFYQFLRDAGLRVTRRYSLGQDVEAACGQLIKQYRRARDSAAHA